MPAVYHAIKAFLESSHVGFSEVRQAPTRTSEESARVRGTDRASGGKAILMKVGPAYRLFVLSGARAISSQNIKRYFGERRIRFATPDELYDLTGLVPGAVPPFGRPVLPFDHFVDVSIGSNPTIAFNAGLLTVSIIMSSADYLRIAGGTIFEFSEARGSG